MRLGADRSCEEAKAEMLDKKESSDGYLDGAAA